MTVAVMHIAACAYMCNLCSYFPTFVNGLGLSLADNKVFPKYISYTNLKLPEVLATA
jgi:hypothetical protein